MRWTMLSTKWRSPLLVNFNIEIETVENYRIGSWRIRTLLSSIVTAHPS